MIKELERYKKVYKECSKAEVELGNKLITYPVNDLVIYSPNYMEFYTENYYAEVYLNIPRDGVKIHKIYSNSNLPTTVEDIKELNLEKQEFEKYIDNLFEDIMSKKG